MKVFDFTRRFNPFHSSVESKSAVAGKRIRKRRTPASLAFEGLEPRQLLATITAAASGNWLDGSTWVGGSVPGSSDRVLIGTGKTVNLNGTNQVAKEIVVNGGTLRALEGAAGSATRKLSADWIHVNSGGTFQIGTAANRYDNNQFELTLTGTNPNADFTVQTATGSMQIQDNNGFLMTAMGGRVQFFGDEKLSFTKLAKTAFRNSTTIDVENVIERNFDGTTSAVSDGTLDGAFGWEVGDEIVIASSSYNYAEEDVRTITGVTVGTSSNGVPIGNTRLTLDSGLSHRHYGNVEYYKDGDLSIDLRAEVALLSRSIVVQGTQDTDSSFGDRRNYGTTSGKNLGIGGHAMFMPGSGQITIDSVQFDKMGQTGEVGRYPVHWHLGADRSGDVMRNSSVTNSNNRGVIVHGTQGLLIESNVLHDIHGHGFFLEDGAEFDNEFRSNIAMGIHKVGGNNRNDPFIVPGVTRGSNGQVNGDAPRNGLGESSHDTGQQVSKRFLSSSAYWITNPDNTLVGNISAGSEGTGFWFILPDRVIGLSRDTGLYNGYNPAQQNLGVFDHNTAHSSPIGLTFDRGSDIRGGGSVGYTPPQRATFNAFTGYKHNGTAVYHRGNNVTFDGSMFADVRSGSFNTFSQIERNILFVGNSQGNADTSQRVGGYKLYDGPGHIIGAHFAGFAGDNAHTFLNTGGANKFAMTRAEGITFENDGTANNLSVYWQEAGGFTNDSPANAAGRPDAISGIVLDVDGSLTGHAGGGAGYVLTPRVDFYRDSTDITPAGWNAYVSDDRFGYLQLNTISGSGNFPYFRVENGDDNRLVVNRRNITRQRLYTKLNAGDYTFTFTESIPTDGFTARMDVMRGAKPGDSTIYNFKGVGTDYRATSGALATSLADLRSSTSNAYFRSAEGDLWMKIFESRSTIQIRPTNAPLPSDGAEIESLVLVDTENDNDIGVLTNGQVINLTSLPTSSLSVRATANEETGSVRFDLSGPNSYRHTRTESVQPYALFGDQDGHFNSEPLAVGQYTLVVTPYSGGSLSGDVGDPVAINFEIIQPVQLPFTDQTVQGGTIIKAREFDLGGQAVAYNDTTAGNSGSSTVRADDDVDTNSNGAIVNGIIDGEWLEFTRDVVPGVYSINVNTNNFSLRNPAKGVRLLIADNVFSDSFTELGSVEISADSEGTSLTIPDVNLTAWGGEDRVFRVEFFAIAPSIVVAPVDVSLVGAVGSYLEYPGIGTNDPSGNNGENWYNGSGLSDAAIVETGDLLPEVWPTHVAGNHSTRVSRIRDAGEFSRLTFDLGGTFDISGMVLWNSTELGQTDRGFENTRLAYSVDGGVTFVDSELLTWSQRTDSQSGNQGNTPSATALMFGPEVRMLSSDLSDVTHVRMQVDNFSTDPLDTIVMASEIRFIGEASAAAGSNLGLNFESIAFEAVGTAPVVDEITRDGQAPDSPQLLARPDRIGTIGVRFDQDVLIDSNDVTLRNLSTGGSVVDLAGASFNYTASTETATWDLTTLSSPLPAGFYEATLSASGVSASGSALTMAQDVVAGLYVALPGDADLDGQVDVLGDAARLVQNLGATENATWASGDFSGDGVIDVLGDAALLVQNLGASVVPAVPELFVQAVSVAAETLPQPLVGPERISENDEKKKLQQLDRHARFDQLMVEEDVFVLS